MPIFQMRDTTFVSGKERSTNQVPLHHAGWFMTGVLEDLAKARVKSFTEHHANGRSGSGEGSKAQLQLRSKGQFCSCCVWNCVACLSFHFCVNAHGVHMFVMHTIHKKCCFAVQIIHCFEWCVSRCFCSTWLMMVLFVNWMLCHHHNS